MSDEISLRDYLAAHASEEDIQHWQAGNVCRVEEKVVKRDDGTCYVSRRAVRRTREEARYAHADAMLKARNV